MLVKGKEGKDKRKEFRKGGKLWQKEGIRAEEELGKGRRKGKEDLKTVGEKRKGKRKGGRRGEREVGK